MLETVFSSATAPAAYDAVVIGAGPVGLACALEAQRRGLSVCVVDKGALVNSLVGYPTNMEFFSTPELLEIGGYPFPTAHYKPLREDALDYYRRVAVSEKLTLRLYERVLRLEGGPGAYEAVTEKGRLAARYVVVATGFFDVPNRLNVPGEDAPHVSYYYKEPYPHMGQHVVVIGAKNSAAKAALQLVRAGAQVTLVVRGAAVSDSVKYWIRPDLLNRIAEGRIRALYNTTVHSISASGVTVVTPEGSCCCPPTTSMLLPATAPTIACWRPWACRFRMTRPVLPRMIPKPSKPTEPASFWPVPCAVDSTPASGLLKTAVIMPPSLPVN
nr:FAD-dependent oxidoreductase [Hymenobacter cellulosilyticus]